MTNIMNGMNEMKLRACSIDSISEYSQKAVKRFVKSLFHRDFWTIYTLYQTTEYLNNKV